MASTASVSSAINSTSNNSSGLTSSQKVVNNKSNARHTTGTKMTDKGRKESPVDSNRRSNVPKAWTGPNPVSQPRTSTTPQANGHTTQSKNTSHSKQGTNKESVLSDRNSHDRLRFLLAGAIGLSVILTTKNGDKYEGIFAASPDTQSNMRMTLKMTKKVQNAPVTQPNGVNHREATLIGASPEHAMAFDLKDIADLTVPEYSLPESTRSANGASSSFQTDADISGNASRGERTLQRWVPEGPETSDFSLTAGSTKDWDQFETHAKMTGGVDTYSEETYTTAINRNAPDYKRREAEAARIAKEIEGQVSTNAHVREERGQALEQDGDDDEEAKYSGVRRDDRSFPPLASGAPNRYMPPAMRPPAAQSTTHGAPVDPAIVSAQLSRPDGSRAQLGKPSSTGGPATTPMATKSGESNKTADSTERTNEVPNGAAKLTTAKPEASVSPSRPANAENPSQGVEAKVLDQFRQFANTERARHAERKKQQATNDKTAKLNDLLKFSQTFKLKTAIPADLVGILAKDPKKQETIIQKAQRDAEEAKSLPKPNPTQSIISAPPGTVPKFDRSQIPPPIPDRNTFNLGRGAAFAKGGVGRGNRASVQQMQFGGPNVPSAPRGQSATMREKNGVLGNAINPIPLPETRISTNTTEQSALSSPRGSNTPNSAMSMKLSAKAFEFRPGASTFAPSGPVAPAKSPSPIPRTASVQRTSTPSAFFGQKKPKTGAQKMDPTKFFNPIARMKKDVQAKLAEGKTKSEEHVSDFSLNGGIPNAYHTKPIWVVKEENQERTYEDLFKQAAPTGPSPLQSRSGSTQAMSYGHIPSIGHVQAQNQQPGHLGGPQFGHHYDEQRGPMQPGSSFASPHMGARHLSFTSPVTSGAQLSYGQPQYFAGPGGQMQMRPYHNHPNMMHAQGAPMGAPMMVAQHSTGPYMSVPQYSQMGMYPSPSPAHVYPQQNGYPSPGRMAPVMMQQGSQQSHHMPQNMMYGPAHNMMYAQQGQMMRPYAGQQTPFGTSPHQPHQMNQRAMSTGYGQKHMPQMPTNAGPPANAPQQPAAFGQMGGQEETK